MEAASGLDPRARTELRGIVRALASMGKTIIISSHILPDIEEISDRISKEDEQAAAKAHQDKLREMKGRGGDRKRMRPGGGE